MVLGLGPQVLENALLPEELHEVPVFDEAMANGVLDRVAGPGLERLVADEEVEVVDALADPTRGAVAHARRLLDRDSRRDDELGLLVAREPELRVTRSVVYHAGWQTRRHLSLAAHHAQQTNKNS